MKTFRRNSIPKGIYILYYYFIQLLICLFIIILIEILSDLINNRLIYNNTYYYVVLIGTMTCWTTPFFCVMAIIMSFYTFDLVEIDEEKGTIRLVYTPYFKEKKERIYSINDENFKFCLYEIGWLDILKHPFFSRIRGFWWPIQKEYVCIDLIKVNKYWDASGFEEILFIRKCGWTKKQLEEITEELSKFKEPEEYIWYTAPKERKGKNPKQQSQSLS